MLNIITWTLLLVKCLAEENTDYIERCIDRPEEDGDQMEVFELIDGRIERGNIYDCIVKESKLNCPSENPEFWEDMYCDESEDDCPSDWNCDPGSKLCYAPYFLPSYYRDLAAPDPRKIVDFKQRYEVTTLN